MGGLNFQGSNCRRAKIFSVIGHILGAKILRYWTVARRLKFLDQTCKTKCRVSLGDLTWRRRPGLTIGLGVSLIEPKEFLY